MFGLIDIDTGLLPPAAEPIRQRVDRITNEAVALSFALDALLAIFLVAEAQADDSPLLAAQLEILEALDLSSLTDENRLKIVLAREYLELAMGGMTAAHNEEPLNGEPDAA